MWLSEEELALRELLQDVDRGGDELDDHPGG
jgi:hypothetical protein